MSAEILLSRGLVTIVDDEDFDWLSQWKWSSLKSKTGAFYAMRQEKTDGKCIYHLMHRVILDAPQGQVVDHIDGNPLNNSRGNLRICDQKNNCLNRRGYLRPKTSRYKGVWWHKQRRKWVASFRGEYIGIFEEEIKAAKAYDEAANRYSPDFALLNFKDGALPCQA